MEREIRPRDVLLSAAAATLAVGFWFWRRQRQEPQPTAGPPPPPRESAQTVSAAPAPQPAAAMPPPEPDPLEEIAGIGAVYARRLREAGIVTFGDLAALSPEQAREMAKAQPWQADPASWIEQARKLNSR